MAKIDELFNAMLSLDGSDLHLLQGQPPKIRMHGRLRKLNYPPLTHQKMVEYLKEICSPDRWSHFLEVKDLDFAYALGKTARFRANYYNHVYGMGAVFRVIPSEIKTLDELKVPHALRLFTTLNAGLLLVTGPTGSGKSTTLAAIINEINETSQRYMVTIEEPVEFVHPNKKCVICQREVGIDANSFADGLKAAKRQDADVILVGEMRDYETISLAINASGTGVLVFGTLHTNSAIKTIDRIIDVFPVDQQNQVRSMLSDSLKGVCAQLLLKTRDGKGRRACNEILLGTPALSATIRENKIPNIRNIIQSGKNVGMQLMDDCIQQLLEQKAISGQEAYLKAIDKGRFQNWAPKEE